jgi:hypothetical protein
MRFPFSRFLILLALPAGGLGPLPAAAQIVPEPTDFLIARVPEVSKEPVIAPWSGGAILAAYPGGSWSFGSCLRGWAPCSGLPLAGVLTHPHFPPDAPFQIGPSGEPRLFDSPTLLPDAQGGFTAVWGDAFYQDVRLGTFGGGAGVVARVFDAPGVPAGPIIVLSQTVRDRRQTAPAAARLAEGHFVVVWERRVPFDAAPRLVARVFQADGTPAGDETAVAPELPGTQWQAAVAAAPGSRGGFLVVWQGVAGGRTEIYSRRFQGLGDARGDIERVDGGIDHSAAVPALATLPEGFAVAWVGERARSGRAFVRVLRLDGAGAPEGPALAAHPFPLRPSEIRRGLQVDIAADGEGGCLVAWNGPRFPGSTRTAVFASAFDAAGPTSFWNRRIDVRRRQDPSPPVVIWDGDRSYIVAWQVDQTPNPQGSGIQAGVQRGRRLVIPEQP